MREIKFRAWNGKKMDYKPDLVTPEGRLSPKGLGWLVIMQFTGLLDKNGKEIYEGDIVKYGYADFEADKTIHQIKYMDEQDYPAFDLLPYLGCDSNGLSHAMAEGEIEIIGNIYENPDLLQYPEDHHTPEDIHPTVDGYKPDKG